MEGPGNAKNRRQSTLIYFVVYYFIRWDVKQIIYTLPKEEGQSPNSHRVRVIVIAVTSILHIYLRPAWSEDYSTQVNKPLFTPYLSFNLFCRRLG